MSRLLRRLGAGWLLAAAVLQPLLSLAAGRQGTATPPAPRRATTVSALTRYPAFFNTQPVRVRGTVRIRDRQAALAADGAEVTLAGPGAPLDADPQQAVEVTGIFVDVGRLATGDPRLRGLDLTSAWQARTGRSWPGVGELLVVLVDAMSPAERFTTPSIRALALDPGAFADRSVTVSGRFRGRNLYGDQPDAPGRSRWDFVVQSADASVWIVGRRPRGDGFSLDVDARVDTARWLEVTGPVRHERGLVWIEATTLALAKQTTETELPSEPAARVPTVGPRPEVVFSAPTMGETDVPPTAAVRIQFSRDIDPATLTGQVRVTSVPKSGGNGPLGPPPIQFKTTYNEGLRVLEIRFDEPVGRFHTVTVELGERIAATDGARLVPWSLSYAVGG